GDGAQQIETWASGTRILRDHLVPRGGTVTEVAVTDRRVPRGGAVTDGAPTDSRVPRGGRAAGDALTDPCDELAESRATATALLTGYPEPAVPIVQAVRRDRRLADVIDRCPGRTAGVRGMGGVPGRRWRRDSVPALPARAPRPARRPRRGSSARTAGRGALVRRLRGV